MSSGLAAAVGMAVLPLGEVMAQGIVAERVRFSLDGVLPERTGQLIVLSPAPDEIRSLEALGVSGILPVDLGTSRGTEALDLFQPLLDLEVRRSTPAAWRLRVDATTRLEDLDVEYDVVDAAGRSGLLSHADYSLADLPATVVPLALTIVDSNEQSMVVEGGFELIVKIGDMRVAGRYQGAVQFYLRHRSGASLVQP